MCKQIVVIDDDKDILEMLEDVLNFAGFSVTARLDGRSIFNDIEECEPDLILIDFLLSGINGGEICHLIKTNVKTRHLPVVMMSASPKVFNSLGNYGCDAFIAKPFDITTLINKINDCLCLVEHSN